MTHSEIKDIKAQMQKFRPVFEAVAKTRVNTPIIDMLSVFVHNLAFESYDAVNHTWEEDEKTIYHIADALSELAKYQEDWLIDWVKDELEMIMMGAGNQADYEAEMMLGEEK